MSLDYTYHKCTCHRCGRMILVEIFLTGSSHNANVNAICADCVVLPLPHAFEIEHPEAAKDIIDWLNRK